MLKLALSDRQNVEADRLRSSKESALESLAIGAKD